MAPTPPPRPADEEDQRLPARTAEGPAGPPGPAHRAVRGPAAAPGGRAARGRRAVGPPARGAARARRAGSHRRVRCSWASAWAPATPGSSPAAPSRCSARPTGSWPRPRRPMAVGRAEAIVRDAAPGVAVERVSFVMEVGSEARVGSPRRRGRPHRRPPRRGRAGGVRHPRRPQHLQHLRIAGRRGAAPAAGGARSRSCRGSWRSRTWPPAPRTALVDGTEHLVLVPAHAAAGGDALAAAAADPHAAVVVYKGGARIGKVAATLADHGRLDGAVLGELLGLPGGRVAPVAEVADRPASYLATLIVPPVRDAGAVISFVGAGPGAADLLTLRAVDRLRGRRRRGVGVVAGARGRAGPRSADAAVHDSAGMTFEDVVAIYERAPRRRDRAPPLWRPVPVLGGPGAGRLVPGARPRVRDRARGRVAGRRQRRRGPRAHGPGRGPVGRSPPGCPGAPRPRCPAGETVAGFARPRRHHGRLPVGRPARAAPRRAAGGRRGLRRRTPRPRSSCGPPGPTSRCVLTTVGGLADGDAVRRRAHHRARPGRARPWRARRPAACCTTRPTPTATGAARPRAPPSGGRDERRGPRSRHRPPGWWRSWVRGRAIPTCSPCGPRRCSPPPPWS